jgi:cellulose synthase/poly-beta-1,6-N-acetylglucosamine synthase-like glycosyltransferase
MVLTHILGLIAIIAVVLFDGQNLLAWSRRRVLNLAEDSCDDFTIIIPLYGKLDYFENRSQLEHLKRNVLVTCGMNSPAMDEAVKTLKGEGWRVLCVEPPQNPRQRLSAPFLMLAALESGLVTTTYSARLDADTVLTPGFGRAIEAARLANADVCSIKCHVLEPKTLCEKMQAQEYRMAMLARHYRPRLTSGACYIAKTSCLHEIFKRHTGVFFSEDIETGRIAYALRFKIRHIDYEVLTAAPESWHKLWKQRTSWWAGNTHHFWVNLDHNLIQLPIWSFYYIALVWGGLWFKWNSILLVMSNPARLPIFLVVMYVLYLSITYLTNWQARGRYMLLIPFYSIFQAMLMPPVGFIRWCYFCWTTRRIYRYRIPYRRYRPLPPMIRKESNEQNINSDEPRRGYSDPKYCRTSFEATSA